jgi:menaquinone-dependent protoporphyrinogen IX oxidase
MKSLIVYYSYTGKNRKVASELAKITHADTLEIHDRLQKLPFFIVLFVGGMYATREKTTKIYYQKTDLTQYERIILSCPLWAWRLNPAMRAFIMENIKYVNKFSICSVSGGGKKYEKQVKEDFRKITGININNLLLFKEAEIQKNNYHEELNKFIKS